MITLTDQLGREVTIAKPPSRIISTVPSQTELLFYLQLNERIAGITKYCIHPADKVQQITKIGGTKQLDIPLIRSLKPDLIIANKEENERLQLEQLMADIPTYISDPDDLPTALKMITDVGALTDRKDEAQQLTTMISKKFAHLRPPDARRRVAYMIWRKPYMVAGSDTFISSMLKYCGWDNAFETDRYPQVTIEELKAVAPDLIFLSSEPYPFKQKHADELTQHLPHTRIALVDGEMFSWYGSRLLDAPEYFIRLKDKLNRGDI